MRPVSKEYGQTLRGSHRVVTECRVVPPGRNGVEPGGIAIPTEGGNVDSDGTADIRSTLDLTTTGRDAHGDSLFPNSSNDLLAPYGNEIFVRRGVRYGLITEWVSLGYYRIQDVEQASMPDGTIRITGQDRMAGFIEAKPLTGKQYRKTYSRGAVIAEQIHTVYPWAIIEWDSEADASEQIGANNILTDDRHTFCKDLITAAGKIWYWDYRGVLVIRDPPNPNTPVWDINSGAGGVMVSMQRRLTREGTYNAVKATGEPASDAPPVWSAQVDKGTQSPTRWNGPFGQVPYFFSSPYITTYPQAVKAAQSLLKTFLGLPYTLDLSHIVNVALEPFDAVLVTYPPRARVGGRRRETHVIDRLNYPLLASGAQTSSTRMHQEILVGEEGEDDD